MVTSYIFRLSYLGYFYLFARSNKNHIQNDCDLYLAPSLIPILGRGVIAGRSFDVDTHISSCPTITVNAQFSNQWQSAHYVYGAGNANHHLLILGPGTMFNHRHPKDAHFSPEGSYKPIESQRLEPFTTYNMVNHFLFHGLDIGTEIFVEYSREGHWFTERGIHYDALDLQYVPKYSLDELRTVGHCLTHVAVTDSTLPKAGKGLFAKRTFSAGEIVSISAVILLPLHEVKAASADSLLLNYCLTSAGSDVALLPLGLGAMANHGGSESNLALEWHGWGDEAGLREKLSRPVRDLASQKFAPLDIAYRATRDIEAGEELTLPYGSEWESAWLRYEVFVSLDRIPQPH